MANSSGEFRMKLGKVLKKFKTKKGNKVIIRIVKWEDLNQLLIMDNELSKEDTFLLFDGKAISRDFKIDWLAEIITEIEKGNKIFICAFIKNRLVGNAGITRCGYRYEHVGNLSIAVAKDFREEGIGKELLKTILEQTKKLKLKIAYLGVFGNNKKAINLYKSLGFKECGRIPKEVFYKNKYIDGVRMYKEI